jgi:UDP-N-acetylglucosamine:LPS N-acetylglucosamine transferase
MEQHKILAGKEKPLLLFSALDWGLGHVTRSIPLIRQFQDQGWEIIVACDSTQKKIFETEIYGLRFAELEGYGIQYSSSKTGTRLRLLLQIPKILIKIKKEKVWLSSFLANNPVKMVVSDNRYGFFHPSVTSIFITHQLHVITGLGSFFDRLLQKFLYKFINKFSECWVPDNEINGLAGKLSHPIHKPNIPLKYIGCISRLSICEPANPLHGRGGLARHNDTHNASVRQGRGGFTYKYCIILSGPEPQRTILESILTKKLKNINNKIIIGGIPGINYVSTKELNKLICSSEIIICRSGYTSMMDLIKLKKKIIVIPTPGQTEQEYLAKYLSEKKLCITINQKDLLLHNFLSDTEIFS